MDTGDQNQTGPRLRWADDHCHIDPHQAASILADARSAGVERFVTVGTDLAGSVAAIEVAAAEEGVWATVGLHPHDASDGLDGLEELLAAARVVAVGECGLDYHYDHSPRPVQRRVFATQVGWAHVHDLPLVVHTREAWEDTFAVLESEGVPARTVFHCFTGGPAEAERCLALGAHLSISGIVTFPSADDIRAATAVAPLDRLLVETDSPYLSPVPHRGTPNTPARVPLVGAAIAEVKGLALDVVAEATWQTTSRVYGLDRTGEYHPGG